MPLKRRPLPNFEACSVALFTSLALGSAALPARAQAPSSTTAPAPRSGTATFQIGPTVGATASPTGWTLERRTQTFKRADRNTDGKLSRQEMASSSGLPRSFDEIDRNKDGSISSAEFDEALK